MESGASNKRAASRKITKTVVDRAKPREGSPYFIWDSDLTGFGLVVHPSGRKGYVARYRTKAGRDRRMVLGLHGPLTPTEARKLALDALGEAARGGDPAERRHDKPAATVKDLYQRFREQHLSKKKAKTRYEAERLFDTKILPALGSRPVEEVTHRDIAKLHTRLARTPYVANRVHSWLRALFTLAERWGERASGTNPCRHIERNTERPRERVLSTAELGRLGEALEKLEREGPESLRQCDVFRLGLLTGGRLNEEVLKLEWSWVNLEERLVRYPDTKAGRPLLRALGPEVVAILKRLKLETGDGRYVFPSPRKLGASRSDIKKFKARVLKLAKLEDVHFHDLRRTKATMAGELGYNELQIATMLGHTVRSVTGRYVRISVDGATRAADEQVQRHLWSLLTRQPEAEVIPLTRRAPDAAS